MSSNRKRPADNEVASSSKRGNINNKNYYHPLQALNDNEKENINNETQTVSTKVHIPPITILKSCTDDIHKYCKENRILRYSIRKISIGHKLFCELQFDYDAIINYLRTHNIEYFTYTPKNNRPYKVILSGLDKMDPSKLKFELCKIGLQCLDVKFVYRQSDNNRETILYVVYLKKGSISLIDLKNKYKSINYIRVKWSYQSKRPNKITQCHNCQMFGHGSNNCHIKTFCAKCAGSHQTSICTSSTIKCANCNGEHTSTDKICPSRSSFVNLRNRARPNPKQQHVTNNIHFNNGNVNNHQNYSSFANAVRNETVTTSSGLFSLEELKNLTLELIKNLKNCKTKTDQFNVITNLAFKFLP